MHSIIVQDFKRSMTLSVLLYTLGYGINIPHTFINFWIFPSRMLLFQTVRLLNLKFELMMSEVDIYGKMSFDEIFLSDTLRTTSGASI